MAYESIKTLFIEEIKKTNEYSECILIEQKMKDEIINPGINLYIIYDFTQPINIDVFKLAFKVYFNFKNENVSASQTVIDMINFLN